MISSPSHVPIPHSHTKKVHRLYHKSTNLPAISSKHVAAAKSVIGDLDEDAVIETTSRLVPISEKNQMQYNVV